MKNEQRPVLSSEYSVKVNFGTQPFEVCLERMLAAKRNSMKSKNSHSGKNRLPTEVGNNHA
jgi:hypothetical protein